MRADISDDPAFIVGKNGLADPPKFKGEFPRFIDKSPGKTNVFVAQMLTASMLADSMQSCTFLRDQRHA